MWMMKSASSKLNQLTLHTAAFKHCGIFLPNAIKHTPPKWYHFDKNDLAYEESRDRFCPMLHSIP